MAAVEVEQQQTGSYRDWTGHQLADWIVSLDESFEQEYRNVLIQAFSEHNITGATVDALDETDFKTFGIINHAHRRRIFAELQKLIARRKRSDSLHALNAIKGLEEDSEENAGSLSDDEPEDTFTHLSDHQWQQMRSDGYCILDDPLKDEVVANTVAGWLRRSYRDNWKFRNLLRLICLYYQARYNPEFYVEIYCSDQVTKEDNNSNEIETFLVPRKNLRLSRLLVELEVQGNRIEVKKVRTDIMHHVLRYLGHHKGVEPEGIAKPIRSVKMSRIVTDPWDAPYMDAMSKKTIFQVILAANYLDCQSLLHLGSAKIATFIKGKSPEEIRNILADDSPDTTEDNKDNDNDDEDDDDDHKEEEKDNNDNDDDDVDKQEENDVANSNKVQSDDDAKSEQESNEHSKGENSASFISDVQGESIVCDTSQTVAKVQIIMTDNRRETVEVNLDTTVKQLYSHAKELSLCPLHICFLPEHVTNIAIYRISGCKQVFKLLAGFPRKALMNPDATIQQLDLAGCSIIQQAI